MQKQAAALQDIFLNQVRKDKVGITIHLLNGFQIRGMVKGFDNYIIILDCDGKQMVIYKHAISTITPMRNVFYSVTNTVNDKNENN